jgi:hypothetical protein
LTDLSFVRKLRPNLIHKIDPSVTPLVPPASTSASTSELPQGSHLNSDLNLAPILFGVVIVFVCCNFPRVVLNIYDFAVVDSIIDCESRGVGRLPPPWIIW